MVRMVCIVLYSTLKPRVFIPRLLLLNGRRGQGLRALSQPPIGLSTIATQNMDVASQKGLRSGYLHLTHMILSLLLSPQTSVSTSARHCWCCAGPYAKS